MSALATRLDEHTVQFVRILPGPIERVWSYLADNDKRREWLGSGILPARIGDSFSLHIKHSDYWPADVPASQRMAMEKAEHRMMHVLLALEPPHHLAYTFQPQGWEETMVDFRLTEEDGNRVRLVLTHSQLDSRKHAADVSDGWHGHLDILQWKLEGKTLPEFSDVWHLGSYEQHYN